MARLRRGAGIVARRRQRFVRTIQARPEKVSLPNQLNRAFTVATPNRVWAADLTYIPTRAGWLYLAVLIRRATRPVVESFFSTLKNELTHDRSFQDRTEARLAIFEYIEGFSNRQRLHQTLGYCSPEEFEQQGGDS